MAVVHEHLLQLLERHLVEGVKVERYADNKPYVVFANPRLTSDGHDLLAAMRSETVWKRVLDAVGRTGMGLTLAAVQAAIPTVVQSLMGGQG